MIVSRESPPASKKLSSRPKSPWRRTSRMIPRIRNSTELSGASPHAGADVKFYIFQRSEIKLSIRFERELAAKVGTLLGTM